MLIEEVGTFFCFNFFLNIISKRNSEGSGVVIVRHGLRDEVESTSYLYRLVYQTFVSTWLDGELKNASVHTY